MVLGRDIIDIMKNTKLAFNISPSQTKKAYEELSRIHLRSIESEYPVKDVLETLHRRIFRQWNHDRENDFSDLSLREVKTVPWVMYYGDPKIVLYYDLTRLLLEQIINRGRASAVKKMIHVYLKEYRKDLSGNDLIRAKIKDFLMEYDKNETKVMDWKKKIFLFFPNGPDLLAQKITTNISNIDSVLNSSGFEGELSQGNFLGESITRIFQNNIYPASVIINKIEQLTETEDHNQRFTKIASFAANKILQENNYNTFNNQQKDIVIPYVLRHLKDPRLPGHASKWNDIGSDQKKFFVQLLAKKDMEVFFHVVKATALDRMWKYRNDFWRFYLPYMENSWVLLGDEARMILRHMDNSMEIKEWGYGRLNDSDKKKSAFLFEIKGFLFVEFSHNGKLRVWEKSKAPFQLGSKNYNNYELKSSDTSAKDWIHSSSENMNWQFQVSGWLNKNLNLPIYVYRGVR